MSIDVMVSTAYRIWVLLLFFSLYLKNAELLEKQVKAWPFWSFPELSIYSFISLGTIHSGQGHEGSGQGPCPLSSIPLHLWNFVFSRDAASFEN